MPTQVHDAIPDFLTLESLEPWEIAHHLLKVIAEEERHVNPANVIRLQSQEYATQGTDTVHRAGRIISEAWAWLVNEGFVVINPQEPNGNWYILSRAGEDLARAEGIESYRHASLFPGDRLHPEVAERTRAEFIRGDYDTAVFKAFRQVEIEVRQAAGFLPILKSERLLCDVR